MTTETFPVDAASSSTTFTTGADYGAGDASVGGDWSTAGGATWSATPPPPAVTADVTAGEYDARSRTKRYHS